MQFDVAVIGAGPGGYVAAIKAAQNGLRVCLIEKDKIGGTCLNVGCIPTKYLLASSAKFNSLSEYSDIGIKIENFDIDFEKMMQGKDAVVAKLIGGINYLIRKNKIELIVGTAALVDKNTISIAGAGSEETVTAKDIILAMGSRPLIPESFGYDENIVCSSDEALSWTKIPESLLIVGGGVVGCELATIYANLGAKVSVVEMQNNLIPNMDEQLANFAGNKLKRQGVRVVTNTRVKSIKEVGNAALVTLSDGAELEVQKVVVSIGRISNIDKINLESVGVEVDMGKIPVDSNQKTIPPTIYAIGDVCSSPYDLAHTAMKEGIVAVENILGNEARMNYGAIPNCVYTSPEIASVGITQSQAEKNRIEVSVGVFSFAGNGKAISMGEAEGFIKVVAHKTTKEILGSQMVGPHVTDIIAQMAIAIENKLTVYEVAGTVFAHPTLSEALWESLESILGGAIHS
jgi:dihydrolipoamide dehydrogenase